MDGYQLFNPAAEKWIASAVFASAFGLILYRKVKIHYVSLGAGFLLLALGIISPASAFLEKIDWDVLGIYWGYGMLAILFRESGLPSFIASYVLARVKKEKYALFFLCAFAAFLSSFMANPVVVIMLAPLAIEMAERLKSPLFLYLVGLAISSNVVTTVTMVADPPALILAMSAGMTFLDFYWFHGKPGLGTISVLAVAVAMLVLLLQFRKLNHAVNLEEKPVEVGYGPLLLFVLSVVALALVPTEHPGVVGLVLGLASLIAGRRRAWRMMAEFDWDTLWFLIGIFIVIGSVEAIGLLEDFARWLGGTGLKSPAVYLLILVWISVVFSAFIDNVPYTVLMIPVCGLLAQSTGISPWPLYFGMLVGTGIGGNLTPVGATANVLACGILEKRGYRVDLWEFLKISWPFSCAAVLSAHILIQLIWL